MPLRFLRWFCREDYIEEIEGDLAEIFKNESSKSTRRASWKFGWRVLGYLRPEFIKSFKDRQPNSFNMFRSYFTIGWRNLLRNKGYSLINIGGLAIGMMVAIMNGLWIWDEFSHNKYFDNYPRIVQVAETGLDTENGTRWLNTTMTYPLGTELIEKYKHQFNQIARASFFRDKILSVRDLKINTQGLYADASAPELFTFKMIYGSRKGLSDAHSILISESLAKTLFASSDPMNQVIRMNNENDLVVTGVYEDFPLNTDLHGVRFVVPWSLFLIDNKFIEQRALNDWRNHFIKIYAEIPDGQSFESVNAQIKGALQFAPEDRDMAVKRDQQLYLYPMADWHLKPTWMQQGARQRLGRLSPILMVKLVGVIGMFVLILACVNFINLSTARSEKRAKEVGIRKTIGSVRAQLISQFLSESFLTVLLSLALAILLTALLLPSFNMLADKDITMPWGEPWFWLAGFGVALVTALLAGSYPALFLSSFNPVQTLKGIARTGTASIPRKVLVVFQFSISVLLLVGTAVVYQQIQYGKNRPVGYTREGLIMLPKRTNEFAGKYQVLRNELKNTGVVYEVSESMGPVTAVYSGNNGWSWKGMDPNLDQNFATLSVSHLHGKTVGWQFVSGRDFDIDNPGDSSGIVINESALAIMKLQDPIGEPVSWTWWADKSQVLDYKILGVIKDVVMDSPYAPVEPTIFYLRGHNGDPSWINVRIQPGVAINEALPKIEDVFRKVAPSAPFDFIFADEEYSKKFGREERIGNISSVFSALAVFISCLGLLGLASFVAETRTKEIGIRKILGATVTSLWKMLSIDFIWLVLIACALATPLAYYFMNSWLEHFPYRIVISGWIFLTIAAGAVALTLATISYQAIKAASTNPAQSLRSE